MYFFVGNLEGHGGVKYEKPVGSVVEGGPPVGYSVTYPEASSSLRIVGDHDNKAESALELEEEKQLVSNGYYVVDAIMCW